MCITEVLAKGMAINMTPEAQLLLVTRVENRNNYTLKNVGFPIDQSIINPKKSVFLTVHVLYLHSMHTITTVVIILY